MDNNSNYYHPSYYEHVSIVFSQWNSPNRKEMRKKIWKGKKLLREREREITKSSPKHSQLKMVVDDEEWDKN